MSLLQKPSFKKIVFHCIFILAVYAILLLIRLPILANADYFLNYDEGFMAADIADLFNGGPFSFYHDNKSYHGTFNSLTAIPFFWTFGVNSLAFKLPGVLFYTLYTWTFFLLAMRLNRKIAWVSVALLVLCPPNILLLTTLNYPHILIAFFGNAAFLIFLSNRDNPSYFKAFYIAFIMGFSFYIYTLSVIYLAVLIILWVLDAKISFRKVFEWFKPSCFREGCARFIDIIILLNLSWILLSFITGGISLKLGDFNLFTSFMKGNIPHYKTWDSNKLYVPFIEFFIFMVILRVVIFRTDILRFFKTMKDSPSIRLWGIGLFGFLIGLTPRWIGLYANSISGHAGYELDLGLPQMWHKLSDLVSVQLPNILELDSSYLGMLVAVLMGVAVFNFLRRDKGGVEIIFAILPILLLSALIIYQKPHTPRHLFPIYGVVVFYISSFLFHVEKKSAHSFWVLLVFLGSYYGYATHSYYKDRNIINGFSILKKDTITDDLIRYAREKQFQAVYTDYSAHKLQFLSGGNPNFVEFHSYPEHGWIRRIKAGWMPNFAVFLREGKNLAVYESHLKDRKISCHRENLYQYLVLSRCLGTPFDVYELRSLGR